MPVHPSAIDTLAPPRGADLSVRASWLLKLERFFPPLKAPTSHSEAVEYQCSKAAGSYTRFVDEMGGLSGKSVLDFGCGWGGETAWLAKRAAQAVGCDIDTVRIREAQDYQARLGMANLSFKLIQNDRLPFPDDTFDAVFSTNVFEHVMRPTEMLNEIRRVLRPNGSFVSTFGPLFYSPRGYHLCWATQVPFAHLLFGFKPVIEVRNLKRTPYYPTNWEETGLNRITFARFRTAARQAGLKINRLKRLPVWGIRLPAQLPGIGNLFTFGIDCRLVKPA